ADILLDKGADVDGKDTFGFTPLMVAAQHGDYDMAWLLLDKGANPALKNQGGYHAMAFAVMKEDEDLVELLLESGADINQPVNVSTNSFSLAEEAKNEKMIAYLTENGGKPNRKPEISEIRAGMGLNFNADDFMVGFSAGVSENKYDMYLTTGFILRPSHVRVLRPENDTLSFQLWEKRFLWPITIGKNFTFRKKGTASAAFYKSYEHFDTIDYMPHRPLFDARVFNLPKEEVANYFVWRQKDAMRNSVNMLGQYHFSHRELHGKKVDEVRGMLYDKFNGGWLGLPTWMKQGFCVQASHAVSSRGPTLDESGCPDFTYDREYIEKWLGEEYPYL
ncbi:hypothetical protein LCGC14_3133820, partial [marine sediment metagenome]